MFGSLRTRKKLPARREQPTHDGLRKVKCIVEENKPLVDGSREVNKWTGDGKESRTLEAKGCAKLFMLRVEVLAGDLPNMVWLPPARVKLVNGGKRFTGKG